jgi:hypothetical protein
MTSQPKSSPEDQDRMGDWICLVMDYAHNPSTPRDDVPQLLALKEYLLERLKEMCRP